MKQPHRPEPVQHFENKSSLEGSPGPWKKPAQPIELPSNNNPRNDRGIKNPYSSRMSNNLHDRPGPSSSSFNRSMPSSSGIIRTNPNATVVVSPHFPSSNRTNVYSDSYTGRPSKRRKTEGSAGPSDSPLDHRPSLSNGKGRKSDTTVMHARSLVIDLDEDLGELISTGSPNLGSPLTPTLSSDDIGLRSKSHRKPSPSVSEFTDSNSPLHFAENDESVGDTGSKFSGKKEKSAHSSAPHTKYLMEKYQSELADNVDDFDNLSLRDSTSTHLSRNRNMHLSQIERSFVKKAVNDIERRTHTNGTDNLPHLDILEMRKKNMIRSMRPKDLELIRTPVEDFPTVPKPPSKPASAFAPTNFNRNNGSGNNGTKTICVPLVEYVHNGRVVQSSLETPLSVSLTQSDVHILHKTSVVTILPLSTCKNLMIPSAAVDFTVERTIVLRWTEFEFLALKFKETRHDKLGEVFEWSTKKPTKFGGVKELVTKGVVPRVLSGLMDSETGVMDSSLVSPTKRAKSRLTSQYGQRPTTRLASRENSTRAKTFTNDTRVKLSPSPSSEELILVYPPTGTGALNITYGDLKRLEPGEFLNDTLIEFGLKLWLNDFRNKEAELADQVHVFSSFFYTQFHQKNLEEGYQNVRKWTSRVDIFKKNYVIVPINENLHWYLAIICYPGRILQYTEPKGTSIEDATIQTESSADDGKANLASRVVSPINSPRSFRSRSLTRSMSPPDPIDAITSPPGPMDVDDSIVGGTLGPNLSQLPHIFTFDSLGSRHVNVLKTLNSYLHMEAKDKKQCTVSNNAHTAQALVPTQPNSCDCGIYLLHFVEQFMSDPEHYIKHILNKPPRKSWSIVKLERETLWNAAAVVGKREALKEKVETLSMEWKQMRKPESKGKGKEEGLPSVPPNERDQDSDIEVLEVTAPGTSNKQKAQRLR